MQVEKGEEEEENFAVHSNYATYIIIRIEVALCGAHKWVYSNSINCQIMFKLG